MVIAMLRLARYFGTCEVAVAGWDDRQMSRANAMRRFLKGFRWCLLPFGQKATLLELGENGSRMAPVPTFDE
jgi:hypothetical protein